MLEKLQSEIEHEIALIEQNFGAYSELLTQSYESKPDLVDMTAIAAVLHSFYNGVENIFLRVARRIDCSVPTGEQWHRELLAQMATKTDDRTAVVSNEMVEQLEEYLSFRHFFRHAYSVFLDWDELGALVVPLSDVWSKFKGELRSFLDGLVST